MAGLCALSLAIIVGAGSTFAVTLPIGTAP